MLTNEVFGSNDPLSIAFETIKLTAFRNVALDAGGNWAIDFPAYEGFTLNVVRSGECWLSSLGAEVPIRLRAGDCFLLTGGRHFTLASNLSLKKRFRAELLFKYAQGGMTICNGGGDFLVFGTIFTFESHLFSVFFGRLPPVIHVDGSADQAAVLRSNLERFCNEMRGKELGRSLILTHLAPIMLLQILRLYLLSPQNDDWLTALSDPRLSEVFTAVQTQYKRAWTLEQLATLARMSRSRFALLFKQKVGISPLVYLMNWRMHMACDMLAQSDLSLAAVAEAVGYGSESAFSSAFIRTFAQRPGAYRKTVKSIGS